MLEELQEFKNKYPVIGDVRGAGMFIGIELVNNRQTKEPATQIADYIVAKFKENFIIMSTEGKYGNVLKFKPPMPFNEKDARRLLDTLRDILEDVSSTLRSRALSRSSSSNDSGDDLWDLQSTSDSSSEEADSAISD